MKFQILNAAIKRGELQFIKWFANENSDSFEVQLDHVEKLLLSCGPDKMEIAKFLSSKVPLTSYPKVLLASITGDLPMLKKIKEQRSRGYKYRKNYFDFTELLYAIYMNQLETAKFIYESGVNKSFETNISVVPHLIENRCYEIVEWILGEGLVLSANFKLLSSTIFNLLAKNGDIRMSQIVVNYNVIKNLTLVNCYIKCFTHGSMNVFEVYRPKLESKQRELITDIQTITRILKNKVYYLYDLVDWQNPISFSIAVRYGAPNDLLLKIFNQTMALNEAKRLRIYVFPYLIQYASLDTISYLIEKNSNEKITWKGVWANLDNVNLRIDILKYIESHHPELYQNIFYDVIKKSYYGPKYGRFIIKKSMAQLVKSGIIADFIGMVIENKDTKCFKQIIEHPLFDAKKMLTSKMVFSTVRNLELLKLSHSVRPDLFTTPIMISPVPTHHESMVFLLELFGLKVFSTQIKQRFLDCVIQSILSNDLSTLTKLNQFHPVGITSEVFEACVKVENLDILHFLLENQLIPKKQNSNNKNNNHNQNNTIISFETSIRLAIQQGLYQFVIILSSQLPTTFKPIKPFIQIALEHNELTIATYLYKNRPSDLTPTIKQQYQYIVKCDKIILQNPFFVNVKPVENDDDDDDY
eukprot:gene7496-9212_t